MSTTTKQPAFVHVLLCDNDFGQHLENATRQVFEATKASCDEQTFKDCVVHLTLALCRLHDAVKGHKGDEQYQSRLEYLNRRINVVYSDSVPNIDHDGGSVAVEVYTGYIWRF